MDFTLFAYKQLVLALKSQDFSFQTFEDYIQHPKEKVVILRHDVDLAYRSQKSEIHRLRRLPQYHLPELPQYDLPDLQGRQKAGQAWQAWSRLQFWEGARGKKKDRLLFNSLNF